MGLCLVIIKPDAVQAGNVGKIITILEDNGYKIEYMKFGTLTLTQARDLYYEHRGKDFFVRNLKFVTSDPVVTLIVSHPEKNFEETILHLRELVGNTDPKKAKFGTIRQLFGSELPKNAVHVSDSLQSFNREFKILFGDKS
jgi:nucleoside-diphosphate kinase